ncbi:hypothetical protein ACH9L7_13335 [Haloferax sp. S1W]|uniref:hypothetical protein n=1 Tax=Haloferax sp. S1W TaxID=3377110 RepID=UPI0037CCA87E
MHELRTCDFCGADAVGVFEMLPPAFTPAPDQRRIVLCEGCRETLTDAVEPLLARLDADASVNVADDAPSETGASVTTDSGPEGSGHDVAPVDAAVAEPDPEPAVPTDHDSFDAAEVNEDDATEAESDGDDTTESDDETTATETESDETTTDEPLTEETSNGDELRPEPPKFRKVIRILQNREFPVERSEVEALASNAYDLDDAQVADIFDYAVERGLLEDDNGLLRKA